MAWILAIDPGNEKSALVVYDTQLDKPVWSEIWPNEDVVVDMLPMAGTVERPLDRLVVEMIASYGMAVGREIFETVYWIGRFCQAWPRYKGDRTVSRLFRKDVKMHLCHSMRATDANIRAALIDRFGPGKEKAVGTKKAPGPLYGIKKDLWSALAVAVTYADTVDLRARCNSG